MKKNKPHSRAASGSARACDCKVDSGLVSASFRAKAPLIERRKRILGRLREVRLFQSHAASHVSQFVNAYFHNRAIALTEILQRLNREINEGALARNDEALRPPKGGVR